MLKLVKSGYGKKLLFGEFLSRELSSCRYKINAFFEWKSKARIFSLGFSDDGNITLRINLNFENEALFSDNEKESELNIFYRSCFISAYVRCLENTEKTVPSSFFQGLVTLEAINDINSGRDVIACSPLSKRKVSVRPIDIHCTIYALSRVCIEQRAILSSETVSRCEKAMDWMINYTRLPEIRFDGTKKTEYALLRDFITLGELTLKNPDIMSRYALFSNFGISSLEGQRLWDLPKKRVVGDFWLGAVMRLLAFSEDKSVSADITELSEMQKYLEKFQEDSIVYYCDCNGSENILLQENLFAVKKLVSKTERLFRYKENAKSGRLHYIR